MFLMKRKPIYVEISIRADADDVWNMTQDPKIHEQWDLRFSSITYLPKKSEDDPQWFRYETNVGCGLKVAGWGKTVGVHHQQDGSKSSSLHFGSDQKISPIREGKGYWRYIPTDKGTTFLTQYDYEPRYGAVGRLFDLFFRPMMGWATALSFDVLKRWIEKGEPPRTQYARFFSNAIVAGFFFFVWLYQGLASKIIANHPEEMMMVSRLLSIDGVAAAKVVGAIGVIETLFAFVWLFYRNKRRLLAAQIVLFPLLAIGAVIASPELAWRPFNPVVLNLSLWALSVIGWTLANDVPTATSCKRAREGDLR